MGSSEQACKMQPAACAAAPGSSNRPPRDAQDRLLWQTQDRHKGDTDLPHHKMDSVIVTSTVTTIIVTLGNMLANTAVIFMLILTWQ